MCKSKKVESIEMNSEKASALLFNAKEQKSEPVKSS